MSEIYPQTETSTAATANLMNNFAATQDQRMKSMIAVATIERTYLSYRDRQMFTLLKHAVRAAEQSWTHDILRKVTPKEAELLKDPSINAKVRFRFGGQEFPPIILFKIYLANNGTKYISGKKTIRPATDAAGEACKLMGNRKFYDQMIIDACQFEKDKVTDEMDVTTVKDYMQYLSNVDETPSYLGGKENYWRQLTLENLPRQSIIYDIVEYLRTKTASPRLRNEMPVMLSRPITHDVQLEQFRAVSRLPSPPIGRYLLKEMMMRTPISSSAQLTQRRSMQSRRRAKKMKKLYGGATGHDHTPAQTGVGDPLMVRASSPTLQARKLPATSFNIRDDDIATARPHSSSRRHDVARHNDDEPADREAEALYEWTRGLNCDDLERTSAAAFHRSTAPTSSRAGAGGADLVSPGRRVPASLSSQLKKRVNAS